MQQQVVHKLNWQKPKGKSFENLVGKLLSCMFPDKKFINTCYVHDGGKDFYTVSDDDDKIWVEAKNYDKHLEISKFANTFIMADISEINRIIIFSLSALTDGARINTARYAAYHKKTISVYAGNDILRLLKKYREKFNFGEFFETQEDVDFITAQIAHTADGESENQITVKTEFYKTTQLNLSYRRNAENAINFGVTRQLPLYSIFAQEIIITNNDLFNEKVLNFESISFESDCFDLITKDVSEKICVPAATTVVIVLFFKLVNYKENISLPIPKFKEQPVIELKKEIFECCWLGEIPFMGQAWELLNELKNFLESDSDIHYALLHGASGVGKSRFIKELSEIFYHKNYKIISLDFKSLNQLDIKAVLKKIISNIYAFDYESPTEVVYKNYLKKSCSVIYNLLFDETYNCNEHMEELCNFLFNFMQKKRIAFFFDNMQDLADDAVNFLIGFAQKTIDNSLLKGFVLCCFNNDFMINEKPSKKIFNYLFENTKCIKLKLQNYSKQDALLYLKECLDPGSIRDDLFEYYYIILKKFGTNPFTLKQLVLYLKQRNIINFIGSAVCISDYSHMQSVLDELPEGINNILNCRYAYLIHNQDGPEDYLRIIWSILFFEKLSESLTCVLPLKHEKIRRLIGYGFVEYDESNELKFSHQLIEKFFCNKVDGDVYNRMPSLKFIDDDEYLNKVYNIVSKRFSVRYCIQEMLLCCKLDKLNKKNIYTAFEKLQITTPTAMLLPMILDQFISILDSGLIDSKTEVYTAYKLCISSQVRFSNSVAAKIFKPVLRFEQLTYKDKLDASDQLKLLFQHYTFLLPKEEKNDFLDWLEQATCNFISEDNNISYLGWIYNRLSKNYCSLHDFESAETYVKLALKIATDSEDYRAIAQAEIEYGNLYAYSDHVLTAQHWTKCADNFRLSNEDSAYRYVYELAYDILAKLLVHNIENLKNDVYNLLSFRDKTFLYQKLLIDDVYADFMLISYVEGRENINLYSDLIPYLVRMKSESYMDDHVFSILSTYKLMTAYILSEEQEKTDNSNKIFNLICELIDNRIFCERYLNYSVMILRDIAEYCAKHAALAARVYEVLPFKCQSEFKNLLKEAKECGQLESVTVLTDKSHKLNLLTFNYEF